MPQVLKTLRIIALRRDEVESRAGGVSALGGEVRSVLPHVLLAAMNTTHRLYRAPPPPASPQSPRPAFSSPAPAAAKVMFQ